MANNEKPTFPSSLEEYNAFIEHFDLIRPDLWGATEDSWKNNAAHLVVAAMLWGCIERPDENSHTAAGMKRMREWASGHPDRELSADVPIVERMLAKGVSEEDISALVQIRQEELAANIAYFANDCSGMLSREPGFRCGLYHCDDEGNPEKMINALDEMFWEARPHSHPAITANEHEAP